MQPCSACVFFTKSIMKVLSEDSAYELNNRFGEFIFTR
jgi:hypothetical protein